jgi:hypothetical protein
VSRKNPEASNMTEGQNPENPKAPKESLRTRLRAMTMREFIDFLAEQGPNFLLDHPELASVPEGTVIRSDGPLTMGDLFPEGVAPECVLHAPPKEADAKLEGDGGEDGR